MSQYDIIAYGKLTGTLTANPTCTMWRSVHKRCTLFAAEPVVQPFNTHVSLGQEIQIVFNRIGDMMYTMYLNVTVPGIVAADSATEGGMGATQFPVFMDGGMACNPAAKMDEAALLEYLPSDYSTLSVKAQEEALKEAKDKWRKEKYGAGSELGCCVEGDADCPDQVCPELGDTWAHYVNDVGHFLIEKAKIIIGGQTIDTLYGLFLYCWEELTGKSGRRLTELTGRRYTRSQLVCDSREERELFIPLPFWFTLHSGNALPLASLAYHGVQVNIELAALQKLIVTSGSHVSVKHARTGLALTPNDFKIQMLTTYIYLSETERDKFASSSFEQLIIQTQQYFKTESKQICRIPLTFNHPVAELIFGVRRQCHEKCNNWGNFSGVDGRDPVLTAELLLNTSSRFGKRPGLYHRGVVPLEVHSNLPEAHIYVMSFSLNPESCLEPAGSLNMSRIDNVELVLELQSALANESYTVFVFARSYNLVSYASGVAGAKYG